MIVAGIILTVLGGLICLGWTGRHVEINRARRDNVVLTPASPGPPAEPPKVTILVAAKDEQDNIGPCLRSLLAQDYPNFEVIAVNDRSSDRTSEIIHEMAAAEPRLRVLDVTELPEGWAGKNNAMRCGIEAATGDYFCMTDADCRQKSTRTLSVAIQHAVDHQVDMLSVLPKLEMRGFWENVVQPVCSGIMVIWFNPRKVNSPTHQHAYANGAFMLIRREAYHQVGGHESVKLCLMEDMHMAARVKADRLRLKVVQNEDLYSVRMYTSFKQIVEGWCRIFFGTFGTKRRLRISAAVLIVMGLLPYLIAAVGLSLWAAGSGPAGLAAGVAGVAAAALQISVIGRFYKISRGRPGLCWTYPLGCVVAMAALAKAYRKHRAGATVVWRDTAYNVGAKP